MTDIEILREVGISSFLYENPSNSLRSMLINAMAKARADERDKAMSEILACCPNDGSDAEIILRRAWDRVRRLSDNGK